VSATPLHGDALDPQGVAAQAGELLDRDRVAQARQLLASALREHPSHMGLLYELARADYLADDNDAAQAALARVLAQDPHHVNARVLMCQIEQEAGNLAHSEEIILGLLRENPGHDLLYAMYARLMLRALNFDKASRLADEALRLDSQSDAGLRARALCDLVMQKDGRPSESLVRLVASNPNDLHTMHMVVVALIHDRRTREAYLLARELLRANPNNAAVLDLVRALRLERHWSLAPLRPLQRWGWSGSIGLWLGGILVLRVLSQTAPAWTGPVTTALLVYVAYSWIWPPLLRRWLAWSDAR
jgi:predicted Zn-dependent protease